MASLQVEDWGLVDYPEALSRQLNLVEQIAAQTKSETVAVCTHPSVVTLGRATLAGDVTEAWKGSRTEIQRGGRATYHGPNQIVIYPLLNLERRGRDLHRHLRNLEQVAIDFLSLQGVESFRLEGATGVWVRGPGPFSRQPGAVPLSPEALSAQSGHEDDLLRLGFRKIASVGIAVKQWISYHGLALNLTKTPKDLRGFKPCGFSLETLISVEDLTEIAPPWGEAFRQMEICARKIFGTPS